MRACCVPKRFAAPTGVRLRHTCKAKYGQPWVSGSERRSNEARTEQHRIEDAVAGADALRGEETSPPRRGPIHHDCTWHTRLGVEYTTSGICVGPNCIAYRDAHSDDLTGVR